jgi:hypothetical protein
VECCTVIPVRGGNGALEELRKQGDFIPPDIRSLEMVLEYGISLKAGRMFADTWDLGLFSRCRKCTERRAERITAMNLSQAIPGRIDCSCSSCLAGNDEEMT